MGQATINMAQSGKEVKTKMQIANLPGTALNTVQELESQLRSQLGQDVVVVVYQAE